MRHIVDGTEHTVGVAPNPECLLCRLESLEAEASLIQGPLRKAATAFLMAYRAASISDEEGLASPEDFRSAWDACDRQATALEIVLERFE